MIVIIIDVPVVFDAGTVSKNRNPAWHLANTNILQKIIVTTFETN